MRHATPLLRAALALVLSLFFVGTASAQGNIVGLGDFEGFSTGEISGSGNYNGGTVDGTSYFLQSGTGTPSVQFIDFVIDGTVARNGSQSLRADYTGGAPNSFSAQFVPNNIPVTPGEEYEFSIWARTNGADGGTANFIVQNPNDFSTLAGGYGLALTTTWQEYGGTFTVPAGVTQINVATQFGYDANIGESVYVDDISITPLAAPEATVAFESSTASVIEGNTVQIPIALTNNDDTPTTVRVSLVGGASSADDADFESTVATVTFDGDRDESEVVEFVVPDDGIVEENESATLRLSVSSGTAVLGSPNVITLTIIDAPPAGGNPLAVVEAEDGMLGAEWTTATDDGVTYITSTDFSAGANPDAAIPQSEARVASYDVTFPQAGTYTVFMRVYVGDGAFNDDSILLAASPGDQDPTDAADWVVVNGLAAGGFAEPTDVVEGAGTLGAGVWKWVRASAFPNNPPDEYITVAAGDLTQTVQIGGREDGLWVDKVAFGLSDVSYTVQELDAGSAGGGGGTGDNLLAFGDFESPEAGSALTLDSGFIEANNGSFTIDDTEAHTGDQSLRVDYTGGAENAYNFQFVAQPEVEPGTEYTASVWAKSTTAGGQMQFAVQNPSDYSALGTPFYGATLSAEWTEYEITFTVPEGLESVNVGLAFGYDVNVGNAVYIDDLSLTGPGGGGGGEEEGDNLVTNGSFEASPVGAATSIEGWFVRNADAVTDPAEFFVTDEGAYDGDQALRVTVNSLGANAYDIETGADNLMVEPGATYMYSIWARSEMDGGVASFTVGTPAPTYMEVARIDQAALTTEWQEFTFEFTAPEGEPVLRAPVHYSYAANVGNPIYIDALSITKIGGTAVEAPTDEVAATLTVTNPIRSAATVRYAVETSGVATVALYDVVGRRVAVLADGPVGPQERTVRLDATGLASGVYVLRLQGEGVMVSRTVTVVR